jgi:hypothetical protein
MIEDAVMPSTTAARTGRSGVNSIEDAFGAFLNELRVELPASAVKNTESVIGVLRHHLNTLEEADASGKFCNQSGPAQLVDHLDRFLRYCVMREMVHTFEQQEFIFFVTYDFCEWLYKSKLLTDDAFVAFQLLRDHHMDMWERACAAAHKIASSLTERKAMTARGQTIDFGRHDIARIEGNQIWLEIWSPLILPEECNIGPITLAKGIAPSLEVGWMITCELAKSKSGWHIVEVGNVYPSLSFN